MNKDVMALKVAFGKKTQEEERQERLQQVF